SCATTDTLKSGRVIRKIGSRGKLERRITPEPPLRTCRSGRIDSSFLLKRTPGLCKAFVIIRRPRLFDWAARRAISKERRAPGRSKRSKTDGREACHAARGPFRERRRAGPRQPEQLHVAICCPKPDHAADAHLARGCGTDDSHRRDPGPL